MKNLLSFSISLRRFVLYFVSGSDTEYVYPAHAFEGIGRKGTAVCVIAVSGHEDFLSAEADDDGRVIKIARFMAELHEVADL